MAPVDGAGAFFVGGKLGVDNSLIIVYTGIHHNLVKKGDTMDKQHGGRRPGAGRKPKPEGELYVKQHISLPPDLFDWLKRTNDRTGIAMSRIIQLALEEYQKKAQL